MSRVRDIVDRRQLFSVEESETVADVARRMAELHVGAIVVLKEGELSGVFSERDLMKRVVLERLDPERTPVAQVMSTLAGDHRRTGEHRRRDGGDAGP